MMMAVSNGARPPSDAHSHVTTPLEKALTKAHIDYTVRNPKSLETYNNSTLHLPGGNTRTVLHAAPFPLTFESGKSCSLQSVDGDTYVDFLGEYTAGIYGHSHPVILEAVQQALAKGWNLGGNNLHEKELAKILCERFGPALEMVRFTNSGTEANLMAIGAAVAYTGRKKILVFSKGYHGATQGFPDPSPEKSMNVPHDFVVAPYNNIRKTRAILFGLQPGSLAAILVEPVQGSGGVIQGTPEFLHYLRDAATEYGAMLIVDEVMTSRLAYGGLAAQLGLRPDLITLGKWIGGGMSFGAFGGRGDIMAMFDPRSKLLTHSGTFNNNVISMAAGVAGCGVYDESAVERLNALGEDFRQKIDAVLVRHPLKTYSPSDSHSLDAAGANGHGAHAHVQKSGIEAAEGAKPIMYVNGVGSMLCIHFSGPDENVLRALLFHHMLHENIYIAARGFMALSLELTTRHVDRFIAALEKFVAHFSAALTR